MAKAATAIAITTALLISSGLASAQEASLSQCQSWQKKIDHYADLRRKGGRVQQMEAWKDQKRVYKDKYQDAKCQKYGRQLRSD